MAKQQYTYNEIITDIRKKQFAPIYVLMGEESYFIDEISELLQNSVVSEEEKDFNFSIILYLPFPFYL